MESPRQAFNIASGVKLLLTVTGIFLIGCMTVVAEEVPRFKSAMDRRQTVQIICHRGSTEFAHENTLEAFRASFELGADGNEIDIRCTKDGVLVCFHDDMLDFALEAYGDVSDYTWDELRRFRFRDPKQFGSQCRIPTLQEAFELHQRYGGLMHLDVKQRDLDEAIIELIERFALWENVIACETEIEGPLQKDSRLRTVVYKASLYSDHGDVFPDSLTVALTQPGNCLLVDDPRCAIVQLGRELGSVSHEPVSPQPIFISPQINKDITHCEAELLSVLNDAGDWDHIATNEADQKAAAQRILARTQSADQLCEMHAQSPSVFAALEQRVRKRSLHKQWEYHGLDAAASLRALIMLNAPKAVEIAQFALWRDDPVLAQLVDPHWKHPRSWADFRSKMVVFPTLARVPGVSAEALCREYLSLDEEQAKQLIPPQQQEAAHALLIISPTTETALQLMKHPLQAVRGRAILDCLKRADEPWAFDALSQGAKHALDYRVSE